MIVMEADGTERYRFVGYLPVDDYLAQLRLGLAKATYDRKEYDAAVKAYNEVAQYHPKTDAAPEAVYWAGVSAYQKSHKPEDLEACARQLRDKYPQSSWATRSSVWLK